MAENYKKLYEQMKKMVALYQDEVVPDLREQLENRVEVVRCKDCKYCKTVIYPFSNKTFIRCSIWDAMVREDDFCSYGERREGE